MAVDIEKWRVSGWYAHSVFIDSDCKHLVRIGPWPSGDRASTDHLAVAFYANGKELASYSTADLISDPTQVRVSATHYWWLMGGLRNPELHGDGRFILWTTEDVVYIFTSKDGKIYFTQDCKKDRETYPCSRYGTN